MTTARGQQPFQPAFQSTPHFGHMAEHCEEFGDDAQMKACADACRSCVEECRSMSAHA